MNSLRLIVIGGVVVSIGAVLDRLYEIRCRRDEHNCHKRTETQLDEALEGTFPASDPTATQDFAIPVNRV